MAHWTVIVACWYAIASVVSGSLYAIDKRRAVRRGERDGRQAQRVRERTLHLADLVGGWPGGLLARRVLRHKTDSRAKAGFVWMSRLIVTGHVAAWSAVGIWLLRVNG